MYDRAGHCPYWMLFRCALCINYALYDVFATLCLKSRMLIFVYSMCVCAGMVCYLCISRHKYHTASCCSPLIHVHFALFTAHPVYSYHSSIVFTILEHAPWHAPCHALITHALDSNKEWLAVHAANLLLNN